MFSVDLLMKYELTAEYKTSYLKELVGNLLENSEYFSLDSMVSTEVMETGAITEGCDYFSYFGFSTNMVEKLHVLYDAVSKCEEDVFDLDRMQGYVMRLYYAVMHALTQIDNSYWETARIVDGGDFCFFEFEGQVYSFPALKGSENEMLLYVMKDFSENFTLFKSNMIAEGINGAYSIMFTISDDAWYHSNAIILHKGVSFSHLCRLQLNGDEKAVKKLLGYE